MSASKPFRITRQTGFGAGRQLTLELVRGRSGPFVVEGPAANVFCLWGETRVISPEHGAIPLLRGELLVWTGGPVEMSLGPGALCAILHGTPEAIRRGNSIWDEPNWMRETHVLNHQSAPRSLQRAVVGLARRICDDDAGFAPADVRGFLDGVADFRAQLAARLSAVPGRTLRHKQRCYERLMRVRLQVLTQPRRSWSLAEMAAEARYSPWHFQRAFAATFGQSPHDFVQEVRLALGRRLLAQPHLSVADVAAAVGYESQSNFTRVLKQRHGVTANALRRGMHRRSRRSLSGERELGA